MYGVWSKKSIMLLPCYENNLGVRLRCDGGNNLGTTQRKCKGMSKILVLSY